MVSFRLSSGRAKKPCKFNCETGLCKTMAFGRRNDKLFEGGSGTVLGREISN